MENYFIHIMFSLQLLDLPITTQMTQEKGKELNDDCKGTHNNSAVGRLGHQSSTEIHLDDVRICVTSASGGCCRSFSTRGSPCDSKQVEGVLRWVGVHKLQRQFVRVASWEGYGC